MDRMTPRAVEVAQTGVPEGTGGVAGQGRYAEAACYDGLCEGDSAGYCQETFSETLVCVRVSSAK